MKIFAAQQELEKQQRKEEDALMERLWVERFQDIKVGRTSSTPSHVAAGNGIPL